MAQIPEPTPTMQTITITLPKYDMKSDSSLAMQTLNLFMILCPCELAARIDREGPSRREY